MPIFSTSNLAANKDMMAKIWTNGDTIICLSRNIVGKEKNACHEQFIIFPQSFQKYAVVDVLKQVSVE